MSYEFLFKVTIRCFIQCYWNYRNCFPSDVCAILSIQTWNCVNNIYLYSQVTIVFRNITWFAIELWIDQATTSTFSGRSMIFFQTLTCCLWYLESDFLKLRALINIFLNVINTLHIALFTLMNILFSLWIANYLLLSVL